MKKIIFPFLLFFLLGAFFTGVFGTVQAIASTVSNEKSFEKESMYLVQLVNQLNAMMPFIVAAGKAQPQNQRMTFHYSAWKDTNGKKHNGLLEDTQLIKKAIEEKLNTVSIEPRVIAEIQGDYVN